MYELTAQTAHLGAEATHAARSNHRNPTSFSLSDSRAGLHIVDICGATGASAVINALHGTNVEEKTIRGIAKTRLGLCYSTVSELNSLGSAFCGLFWDPDETFVIAAFRGTSPSDFKEWTTDLTFQMREAGLWLTGFGRGEWLNYRMKERLNLMKLNDSS